MQVLALKREVHRIHRRPGDRELAVVEAAATRRLRGCAVLPARPDVEDVRSSPREVGARRLADRDHEVDVPRREVDPEDVARLPRETLLSKTHWFIIEMILVDRPCAMGA